MSEILRVVFRVLALSGGLTLAACGGEASGAAADAGGGKDAAAPVDAASDLDAPPGPDAAADVGPVAHGRLFYASRVGGPFEPYQVFSMALDGTDVRQVTSGGYDNDHPVVSPDGTVIAFTSRRDQAVPDGGIGNPVFRMIYLMDPGGGDQRRLTNNPIESSGEIAPSFSPDGQWIVFQMSSAYTRPAHTFQIYRRRLDGSGQQRYVPQHPDLMEDGNHEAPIFVADGAEIVFRAEVEPAQYELFAMNADGTQVRRLTHCLDEERSIREQPILAPDGSVYFVTRRDIFVYFDLEARMERVTLDGQQEVVFPIESLTTPEEMIGTPRDRWFSLAPAGDRFVHVRYDDFSNLFAPTFAILSCARDGSDEAVIAHGGYFTDPYWY